MLYDSLCYKISSMTELRNGPSGFLQLLESGAAELKDKGNFSVELSPQELEQTMRQVVAQSEAEMKKQGVTASIDQLAVQIAEGKGQVQTAVTASKKVGFVSPKVGIKASFGLENVNDQSGQSTGRLRTTQLEVQPETLFMVVKPRSFLAPYVENENINGTFRDVLDAEMQARGAKINTLNLAFTPQNTLKVDVSGSRR